MNHVLDFTELIDSLSIHCKESLEGTEFRCRHLHCKYLHSSKWFLHLVTQSIRSSPNLLKHLLQVLWSRFFFCLCYKPGSGNLRVIMPQKTLFSSDLKMQSLHFSLHLYPSHNCCVPFICFHIHTKFPFSYIFSRLKNPSLFLRSFCRSKLFLNFVHVVTVLWLFPGFNRF